MGLKSEEVVKMWPVNTLSGHSKPLRGYEVSEIPMMLCKHFPNHQTFSESHGASQHVNQAKEEAAEAAAWLGSQSSFLQGTQLTP
jgi:hypothetical protein